MAETTVAKLPFQIGSRQQQRPSFTVGPVTLQASANSPQNPIQVPAMGFLRALKIKVVVSGTATGTPTVTADGPFNAIAQIGLRNAAGDAILVPVTGYQLYLINKYGGYPFSGAAADPKSGSGYSYTVGSGTYAATFFLYIPLELDQATGLGAIPALSSNRSYQLDLILSSYNTIVTGTILTGSVTITGTALYWALPSDSSPNGGIPQETQPMGLGTLAKWQLETPPVTPGDKLIQSNNVGGFIRTIIFALRNSSGARIETNGWPSNCEFILDNETQEYLEISEWKDRMIRQNQWLAAIDVAGGLDTGVFALQFSGYTGAEQGETANSRAQILPTGAASMLQLRGTSFGSASSTLEILTQSISTPNAGFLYGKL